MQFADVAVDAEANFLRPFCYSNGSTVLSSGDVVTVPFGRQTLYGIVVNITDTPSFDPSRIRVVHERVQGGPFIDERRLNLGQWISRYYRCGLYSALALMLPPRFIPRLQTKIMPLMKVNEDSPEWASMRPREKHVLELLEASGTKGILESTLIRRLGVDGKSHLNSMIRQRKITRATNLPPIRGKLARRKVFSLTKPLEQALKAVSDSSKVTTSQRETRSSLLRTIESMPDRYIATELVAQFGGGATAWARKNEHIVATEQEFEKDPLHNLEIEPKPGPQLSTEQAIVINTVISSTKRPGRGFLLFGATGSGKTEVYLQLVKHVLSQGKQAIVLVPEISLTEQLLHRFAGRFPERVATLHSGLTDSERLGQWYKVHKGERDIVLGSRSALFAPVNNLGLIVMDEEHEWAYEQHNRGPRYSARAAALRLSQYWGCPLVLGSATPDVGSFFAAERGRLQLLRLPNKTAYRKPTIVHVVDMRNELRHGHSHILSRRLIKSMRSRLANGEQVILFLNRRGYAAFIECLNCGTLRNCTRCELPLTLHLVKEQAKLICHHCGMNTSARSACRLCGGKEVARNGFGIQALEDKLKEDFPGEEIIRWDSDSTKTAAAHTKIWHKAQTGDASILIGTQMVAKGHHFPNVTLAAAVAADIGLSIPDFRAPERTFQILTQLVGRAGRGKVEGEAIIQTFTPAHYAVACAAVQDAESFYQQEITKRSNMWLPPFTRICRLECSDKSNSNGLTKAQGYLAQLRQTQIDTGNTQIELYGPVPAWPHRLRGLYRWRLILKGNNPFALLDVTTVPQGWRLEVDPVST